MADTRCRCLEVAASSYCVHHLSCQPGDRMNTSANAKIRFACTPKLPTEVAKDAYRELGYICEL